MSNSFNGVRLGSDHQFDDDNHLEDDHDDDGSKEHTQLLQQDSSDTLRASNRRNGNRSMVHSLYASPKHAVSQRRQASVPGSPIHNEPHSSSSRGAAPLFMNNVAGLWDNDTIKDHHPDETDGGSSIGGIHRRSSVTNSRPTSSLILDDDVTPPLPWKEPVGQFAATDRLSASKRFSMDAIADVGAFAVPSSQPSLSDSQSLPPPSFTESASVEPSLEVTTITTPAAEPKKRRWGPKSQKATAAEPVVPEEEAIKELVSTKDASSDTGALTPTKDITEPVFSPQSYDSPSTTAAVTIPSTPSSGQSSPTQNKISQTGASSFGLSTLSGTGRGLVSGLTSLKNSIMIPALSSTPSSATPANGNSRGDRTPGSLTGSQSSLLEFLEDSSQPSFMQHQEHHHHHRHHTTHRNNQQQTSSRSSSTASSVTGSPSLFRSMFLRSGNESEYFSGRDADGSSSMFLERKKSSNTATPQDRSRMESHHHHHHHHTPRHSTYGLSPETKGTSLQQQQLTQKQSRRKHVASQNTSAATQSLSTHELELQQQMQRQSQLSTRKIELCKELLSLYSRRNSSEQRQAEAVKAERFEEADAATTAIGQVQERISQLEGIYADTDRSLWECKKRQDELGRKICEFHPMVLREMDDLRLKREAEREQFAAELNQRRESEVAVLQGERDEIEKDRSDVALEQDFLGKNQSELKERIDEETRIDQDELNDLKEKRKANRSEIEELTRQLEHLNQKDKEWALEIATVQQRIRTTEEQFSEKSKEVMQDKQKLDHRISDLQKRSQRLDRQEAQLQIAVENVEGALGKIQSDVQAIVAQQEHLETVRKMFGDELAIIQKLRVEEEGFREKEAGWSMRSIRWTQDLVKLEGRIKKLTDKVAGDQKVVVELEESMEGLEKRVGQCESLKVLAVQRRDFKQASHYSGELAKLRETMAQQREELEKRTGEITNGSAQKDLAGLQKEYDALKASQKQEQLDLFKEIQAVTTETLARLLSSCSRKPMSNGSSTTAATTTATTADKSTADAKKEEGSSKNTAAGKLLEELQSEIESVLEISRIRYGRETTVPHAVVDGSAAAAVLATAAGTTITPTAGGDRFVVDKEEQRAALERDIQAAVAEEDYANAAELQERLEAL